ncbi:MAG: hypothetical protein ABSD58_02160 [Verrucomicrobiia bacterium]|jgi:hypothetical protein
MNRKLIKALVSAITAVLALRLADHLEKTTQLTMTEVVVVAALFAAVFAVFVEAVVEFCRQRVRFIRKQLDPRARFEGVWLIQVAHLKERPYAYATIDYNAEADAYSYTGVAFDVGGTRQAQWACPKADFDLARNEIRFDADAELVDVHGRISHAFGHIRFEKVTFGRILRYSRGEGFFVDFGSEPCGGHFICDRLYPKTVRALIGKKQVITNQDMADLIVAFHKQKPVGTTGTTKATGTKVIPLGTPQAST